MDKASLFAALAAEVKKVKVEALGLELSFKVMTGKARDAFQKAVEEGDKSFSFFESAIVTATVVDEAGAPLFDASDIDALREQNAVSLSAVAAVAMDVNKIGVKAEKEAQGN